MEEGKNRGGHLENTSCVLKTFRINVDCQKKPRQGRFQPRDRGHLLPAAFGTWNAATKPNGVCEWEAQADSQKRTLTTAFQMGKESPISRKYRSTQVSFLCRFHLRPDQLPTGRMALQTTQSSEFYSSNRQNAHSAKNNGYPAGFWRQDRGIGLISVTGAPNSWCSNWPKQLNH